MTAYQGLFTTRTDPSLTAPAIVATSPLNGVGGVPLNALVEIGYTLPLNPASVTAASVFLRNNQTGTIVATTLGLDSTGTVIRMVPSLPLLASTAYCYFVQAGVFGTNGLAAATTSSCFTTGVSSQSSAPEVLSVSPAGQLQNVPLNANVRIVFSGPIDPLTVTGTTVRVAAGSQTSLPAAITFSTNNQVVVLMPQTVLPASAAVTVTIDGVSDVAGNPVPAFTQQFRTSAAPAGVTPAFLNINPMDGATGVPTNVAVAIRTNAVMDISTATSSTVRVRDNLLNVDLLGTYSLSQDGMTIFFTPAAPLATGRNYTVSVNSVTAGLTDVVGKPPCCAFSFSFTSGAGPSAQGPSVTAVSPREGMTGVPTNARIAIQFDQPIDVQTTGDVRLVSSSGTVGVLTSLGNGNQTLNLVPLVTLRPNARYTPFVEGVADTQRQSG